MAAGNRSSNSSLEHLPPAIVIGSGAIAIAVARSLRRARVTVHGWGGFQGPASSSRHYASFASRSSAWAPNAENIGRWAGKGPRRGVLFPTTDDAVEAIATRRSELEELGYTTIEMDDAASVAMLDKPRTYELARQLGVATPATAFARGSEPPDCGSAGIGYPCALKPVHSHRFARYFDGREPRISPRLKKAFVVENEAELRRAWRRMADFGLEGFVTEIIPGPDTELFAYVAHMDDRSQPSAELTNRKVRQHPRGFGVACYSVRGEFPAVAQAGRRLLQGLRFRGPAHVEFKRDARDGTLILIECNPRLTIELLHAPVNLPLVAYQRAVGAELPARGEHHRAAVRLWDPLVDLRSLRDYRRHRELSLRRWAGGVLRGPGLYVFDWRDPGPTLSHHARAATRQARLLAAKLR